MKLTALSILGIASMLACGSPATAQTLEDDTRCFVASNMFAERASDEKAKRVALLSAYFYLGRLNASAPQLEAAIRDQAKTLNAKNAGPIMQACAKRVGERSDVVQNIGKKLGTK